MIVMEGKSLAQKMRTEIQQEIKNNVIAVGRPPCLAVILAGDDPASRIYVNNKEKACAEAGILSINYTLDNTISENELLSLITKLNQDDKVDGILLQLPLPKGIDSLRCISTIDSGKDVDGFHPENVGKLCLDLPGFVPCTPAGIIELMKNYGLTASGKKAVIIGRSNIVGKPMAMLLSQKSYYANATVTLCHSRTVDLAKECKTADFLILALGRPKFVTADMIKKGVVIFDVGINRTEAGLCGDADFKSVSAKCAAITPVPGGVGPMTIAMLLKNTLTAWKIHNSLPTEPRSNAKC